MPNHVHLIAVPHSADASAQENAEIYPARVLGHAAREALGNRDIVNLPRCRRELQTGHAIPLAIAPGAAENHV